jgi:hypothetical protein
MPVRRSRGAPSRRERLLNYARRQQYRRLSRAALAATASGACVLLALAIAGAGAVTVGGALLVLALGIGPLRSPLAVARRAQPGGLAPKTRSGVRSLRFRRRAGGCGTRCLGGGAATSIRWRLRRPAWRSRLRRRLRHMTSATSRGCASRRRGCRGGVGGGVDAARCRSCAWLARGASSGSSRACW